MLSDRQNCRGFTLIEMMIVLAILAIIIAIAVPAYQEYTRKARRADAASSLMAAAQYLERCFTRDNTYASCGSPAGASEDGYYTISVARAANTYTLTAAPNGDQASDDCGSYTIDHLGNKTPTPSAKRCWGTYSE